jgi:NAD(P)-dependent dehydrogenase (short-subunit alcohol dehydrogenase family)
MSSAIGPESLLLTGRVAIVTGAARGIGRATALAFARLGASVAVCDKLPDELAATTAELEAVGRPVVSSLMDVRDPERVEAFVAEVAAAHHRIDVLVNNAGGGFKAAFTGTSPKGEAALIAENFTQVTSFIRACVPHMAQGGAIVNVTSIEAHRAGPGFGIYSAMKAGQASLTKTLALELAGQRIRVNAVAPDMIPTAGDAGLVEEVAGDGVGYDQPWPDGGTPEDVAGAIVFLVSDLARFVTGSTVHVDGGTLAAAGWRRGDAGSWIL